MAIYTYFIYILDIILANMLLHTTLLQLMSISHHVASDRIALHCIALCNSVETSQPGDRTINPDIVMPECYASSQRVDLLARVVITPVHHTHTRLQLHCIALHGIALHCIALHCIALHCMVLHGIALHCIAMVLLGVYQYSIYSYHGNGCVVTIVIISAHYVQLLTQNIIM